jgi:hypothetical protein
MDGAIAEQHELKKHRKNIGTSIPMTLGVTTLVTNQRKQI